MFVPQTKRCLENDGIKCTQRLYVKCLKALINREKNTSGSKSRLDVSEFAGSAPASINLTAVWTLVFHVWRSKAWAYRWQRWSKFVDLLSVLTLYDPYTVSTLCPTVFEHQWRPVPKMWRGWKFALLISYLLDGTVSQPLKFHRPILRIQTGVSKRRQKESRFLLYTHNMCIRKCQNLFDHLFFFRPATALRPSRPLPLNVWCVGFVWGLHLCVQMCDNTLMLSDCNTSTHWYHIHVPQICIYILKGLSENMVSSW